MIARSTNRTVRILWFDHRFKYPPDIFFLVETTSVVPVTVVELRASSRCSTRTYDARGRKGGAA